MGSGCSGNPGKGNAAPTKDNPEKYINQKYKMGKALGKGGSCSVVVATERATSQRFALKILKVKEKINQDLFEKERKVLTMLNHPNILSFKEAHIDEKNYYLVTGLCEGGELFDRIVDKDHPITEKRASQLIRTMLEAIQHCHKRQIIHRDIKPENFVFKTREWDSEMVLIDFGCAKIVEDNVSYKDLVGTPYYLAPESAIGQRYNRTGLILKSSDLWAIGVIAYVCMTGRPPFNGNSNTEIFSNIVKKPLKFPKGIELTPPFKDFCQKVLKKSPKKRLSLEHALQHPWVSGEQASEKKISPDVIRVLRQFNKQSKLKKAITKVLAANMGDEPKKKIREHFSRLDKNNDGSLDLKELTVLLTDMGIAENEAREDAKAIMTEGDADGNGEIEFEEFAQIWQRKLLTVNESYIRAVFNVLDEDKNGTIESGELARVLNMEGKENELEIKDYISEVDTDKDGKINFEEFKAAMLEKRDFDGSKAGVGLQLEQKDIESNHDLGNVNLDASNN